MVARGNSRTTRTWGRRATLTAGVAAIALVVALSDVAVAQVAPAPLPVDVSVPDNAKLFLEADTVAYESNAAVVTATGGVQIDYGGYKLVARKVVYNQKTKRLVATGDVQLQQPDGNLIYADSADITDDFADGFVRALRIESPENTRFAAQGAVRENGNILTLERGVYTACEACRENPDRPPLWQVKARKIVWDQQAKIIRYYGASLEFFGLPLAYLPYLAQPDPTVKRKSGFLIPSFRSSGDLGYGLRVPYFFALSDSYDATVAGTYYSKQGFLGEVEFRQAIGTGYYTVQAAGISQQDPDTFEFGSPDFDNVDRGMIGTTGRFAINEKWTVGWDWLFQSDQDFSETYDIENFNQTFRTSEVYLTGLGDRSFFDLRVQRFDVQSDDPDRLFGDDEENRLIDDQDVQPDVFPTLDYERIEEGPLGGEVEIDANLTYLRRGDADTRQSNFLLCEPEFFDKGRCGIDNVPLTDRTYPYRDDFFRRRGLEGDYGRGTLEAEWRRTFTTEGGLLLTPFGKLRGDVYSADMSIEGRLFPADPAAGRDLAATLGGYDLDDSGFRGMATAGLEARYPILFEARTSSHILEPIAQVLVRPDETGIGALPEQADLPNEDAQSLVLNAANLFAHDKFSGYDRIEGGTRANVGLRYSGTFDTGYAINATVGQSYHLFGDNPYQDIDLALVGPDSGLETDRSDYVGSFTLATPVGLAFGVGTRLDEDSLDVRRTDFTGTYANQRFGIGATYSQLAAQPIYGFPEDRSQAGVSANLKLTTNWTAYGSLGYDIENDALISRSVGVGYLDECFSLLVRYTQTEDRYELNDAQSSVFFRLALRTLAETDYSYKLDSNDDD